jgi:hypothetical protein
VKESAASAVSKNPRRSLIGQASTLLIGGFQCSDAELSRVSDLVSRVQYPVDRLAVVVLPVLLFCCWYGGFLSVSWAATSWVGVISGDS